jgi:membrane protein implicated in regulation of membrane protease activity
MATLPLTYWLFLTAMAVGAVLGIGALLGGGDLDADADADVDVDADLEVDADVDADLDGDVDGDADAHAAPGGALTTAADASEGAVAQLFGSVLGALGFGRIPFGALLSLNTLLFGGSGVVLSELLTPWCGARAAGLLALPLAALSSLLLSARVAAAIARYLPSVESHGATRSDLIGRLGRTELDVDGRFGRVLVRDSGGALHQVRCVTGGTRLPRGVEVVLTDFDPDSNVFTVVAADLLEAPAGSTMK